MSILTDDKDRNFGLNALLTDAQYADMKAGKWNDDDTPAVHPDPHYPAPDDELEDTIRRIQAENAPVIPPGLRDTASTDALGSPRDHFLDPWIPPESREPDWDAEAVSILANRARSTAQLEREYRDSLARTPAYPDETIHPFWLAVALGIGLLAGAVGSALVLG